jgi:hypothetical protein
MALWVGSRLVATELLHHNDSQKKNLQQNGSSSAFVIAGAAEAANFERKTEEELQRGEREQRC